VYGPADGLHGLAEVGPCDIFCFFSVFSPFLTLYYWIYFYIFLFLHITKASPRLTPYHLKGKKGVGRLKTPYRLKNYAPILKMSLHGLLPCQVWSSSASLLITGSSYYPITNWFLRGAPLDMSKPSQAMLHELLLNWCRP
jgi:hypothetical protein